MSDTPMMIELGWDKDRPVWCVIDRHTGGRVKKRCSTLLEAEQWAIERFRG